MPAEPAGEASAVIRVGSGGAAAALWFSAEGIQLITFGEKTTLVHREGSQCT